MSLAKYLMMAVAVEASYTAGKPPPAAPAAAGGPPASTDEVNNEPYAIYLVFGLAALVVLLLGYRLVVSGVRYLRTVTTLQNDTQRYFRQPNRLFAFFKEHLFYAPLFGTRHHNELRLARGWGVGILPTRFQSFFLAGVIGVNVLLCALGIEWSAMPSSNSLNHLRNRSGTLAVINMIPLVVLAGRNNPLIPLLNMSYDTFNLMHRWFGRIVVAEMVTHTVAWGVNAVIKGGWASVVVELQNSWVIITGTMGTAAAIFIVLHASALMRHAFYEVFLHLHFLSAVFLMVVLWMHLNGLYQQMWLAVAIVAWGAERLFRLTLLVYRSVGRGGTQAVIEALPGDAVRVTVKMARPWAFRPGQHMYLTIPSLGLWTSHPFSVAWSSEEEQPEAEKGLVLSRQDVLRTQKATFSAIVRRRHGFTDSLFKRAEGCHEGRLVLHAYAEGPYGGHHSMHSYGTVLMFAAGVGITHHVPYVRDLVAGFANGTVSARRVILVWIIQSPEHLEWIRPWMTSILALDRRRDILRIQLFVTRPRSTKEIHSPSATVQMFPGRPNVDTLIGMESDGQIGAMAVSVCGTGSLADDVRRAVRKRQATRNIDFVEEAFSW